MYRTQQKKRSEPSMGAKPSAQEVEAEDRRPEVSLDYTTEFKASMNYIVKYCLKQKEK